MAWYGMAWDRTPTGDVPLSTQAGNSALPGSSLTICPGEENSILRTCVLAYSIRMETR